MATGGPIMNGDIPRPPSQPGTLEETLQQMNILIQENRDLKGKSRCVVVGSELRKMFFSCSNLFVVVATNKL